MGARRTLLCHPTPGPAPCPDRPDRTLTRAQNGRLHVMELTDRQQDDQDGQEREGGAHGEGDGESAREQRKFV